MSSLIDVLPGLPMPVSEVTRTLAHMWDAEPGHPGAGISDFRASQMNLILHFGLRTSEAEARELFETSIQFAQRYPCRIVVLCPHQPGREGEGDLLTGKLYTQCFIGREQRDMCCCEALILGYSTDESDFLENQISLWLESDLPVYHWFHRVPAERIIRHYRPFLSRCHRILHDSAFTGTTYESIDWPDPARVRDLVRARMLPIRQSLGQFLSQFEPEQIVRRLGRVTVQHSESHEAEARFLLAWMRGRIEACCAAARIKPEGIGFVLEPGNLGCSSDLAVDWEFSGSDRHFSWEFHGRAQTGRIICELGTGRIVQPLHLSCMKAPAALAEALFF